MSKKAKSAGSSQDERRKVSRRPVLDSFSFFLVLPQKGYLRLPIQDISEMGIGFDLDTAGEDFSEFPVETGEKLAVQFYLNQSLYIPLQIEIRRVSESGTVRQIGAQFIDQKSKGFKAFRSFMNTLESIVDAVELVGG